MLLENTFIIGDAVEKIAELPDKQFQLIIADPPYFQVLLGEKWDNQWQSPEEYLAWTMKWVRACRTKLCDDGLFYIFGQLGKREHTWLHACSQICRELAFHDMIVWDRAVGYNERSDSFTPQYEMALAVKKTSDAKPRFDKDAVRIPYDEETIAAYLSDNRYKDMDRRREHLRKGKYATNILRVPSLKGNSKEKIGHPSQKPIKLIEMLVASSSREGDWVLDPFMGSGTTAEACDRLGRKWVGIEINPAYAKLAKQRIAALKDSDRQHLFPI
jgi:DNA modification methylase